MTSAVTTARPDPARHPLFERLTTEFRYAAPTVEGFDAFVARRGHLLLFFADDPERIKETLDLAVILPEVARAFRGRFEVGVLLPAVASAIAPRYGVRRWPALVMLRDGEYVGAIEGIRDWEDYRFQIMRLLEIEPSEPPKPLVPPKPARQDGERGSG
ncbi:MAG TPA: hydrogenase-1 expression HyaE [Burkholderiales bacterium]|nr:hydrogenase-1 expression HyaE [Burkholderiales bacterium]